MTMVVCFCRSSGYFYKLCLFLLKLWLLPLSHKMVADLERRQRFHIRHTESVSRNWIRYGVWVRSRICTALNFHRSHTVLTLRSLGSHPWFRPRRLVTRGPHLQRIYTIWQRVLSPACCSPRPGGAARVSLSLSVPYDGPAASPSKTGADRISLGS